MEVLDSSEAVLSNFEVLLFLREEREKLNSGAASASEPKRKRKGKVGMGRHYTILSGPFIVLVKLCGIELN